MLWAWLLICTLRFLWLEPALSITVYRSLLRAIGEFSLNFPDGFFVNLLITLLSLTVHGVIGALFLRLFIRLPRLLELTLASFVGIGFSNFWMELLAIGFWLNPLTVWLLLILQMAVLGLAKRRWGWAGEGPDFQSEAPAPGLQTRLYWAAFAILTLITLFTFYHALMYPVDYWDALILYINYGKLTYEQNGFPILYCLQVGLGLGANYPHLYPLFQSVTAFLFDGWSNFYGQFMPPLAGAGCMVVLYYLVLHLFRSHWAAIFSVLAFRQIAYVSAYLVWASDYALVMQYTAIYLLFLAWFLHNSETRSLQPLLLVSAVFPHINYLGWIVWPITALAMLYGLRQSRGGGNQLKPYAASMMIWLALALTWYVRNWLVTGNPVYAFFPEIFGGKNINLEVLQSAQQEWMSHGFGAYHLGRTVLERFMNTPALLLNDYRFAPVVIGLLLPSLLLRWKRHNPFFLLSGLLVVLYVIYEYFVSGFYFYHILAVFPILTVFAGRFLHEIRGRWLPAFFGSVLILSGLVPGLSFAIMGTKVPSPELPLLTRPGLSPMQYYLYRFSQIAPLWRYINNHLPPNAGLLTHDNRYLVYRDDIRFVHLDDCELVPRYGQPYPETHAYLLENGVRYYLRIPDEDTHPITQRLGHREYQNTPAYFKEMARHGETILYRLVDPQSDSE